jgi:hypothetical protein
MRYCLIVIYELQCSKIYRVRKVKWISSNEFCISHADKFGYEIKYSFILVSSGLLPFHTLGMINDDEDIAVRP